MADVMVIGGGPVGVFLACELRLCGLDPVVIERRTEINGGDKAHGLTGQVVRLLDHRGLFERLGTTASPVPVASFFFGAIPLHLDVLGDHNPMYALPVNQRDLERVLNARAAELGIEIRRGTQLSSFRQLDDHVEVVVLDRAGGTETTLETGYLIGCDGARSQVRKQCGIAFPGHTDHRIVDRSALVGPSEQFRAIDGNRVQIAGLGTVPQIFHRTERGVISIALMDPQHPFVYTAEWEDEPPGNHPGPGPEMTLSEMEASVQRVLGVPLALRPPPPGAPTLLRRLSGRNTRVAARYRDRRVFLAGDAAHVHSAAGGPGLNLALQDAANLAWKLAADLHGWAPQCLLDSYQSERHPVGRRVFTQTQAQTALMAPGADVTALRELFAELLAEPANVQTVADLLAGADVRYNMGEPAPEPLTGWFVPTAELSRLDGTPVRLPELLRDSRPTVIDTGGGELCRVTTRWRPRVGCVRVRPHPTLPSMLIRPDGYVAWSGTNPALLEDALTRWFGTELRP